jgi:hypothetical protein
MRSAGQSNTLELSTGRGHQFLQPVIGGGDYSRHRQRDKQTWRGPDGSVCRSLSTLMRSLQTLKVMDKLIKIETLTFVWSEMQVEVRKFVNTILSEFKLTKASLP